VAVGNTVSLIEVMQSFTPIVAEQAGVRNPAAFPGAQLIRFEDATCAHAMPDHRLTRWKFAIAAQGYRIFGSGG